MTDDFRDEKGRIIKGHPGLNRKQAQPDTSPTPEPDLPSPDFDEAIIKAAHSYGTGSKGKVGLAGYCANLRDTRPVEYATLLSKALARKAEAATSAITGAGVTVNFTTAPSRCTLTRTASCRKRLTRGPNGSVRAAIPTHHRRHRGLS